MPSVVFVVRLAAAWMRHRVFGRTTINRWFTCAAAMTPLNHQVRDVYARVYVGSSRGHVAQLKRDDVSLD